MTGLAEYLRLFTAVLLDPPLRRAIREEADLMLEGIGADGDGGAGTGKLSHVREENLHVTLKFIGDVHRDDLPALDEALADGGRLVVPGEIEVEGLGAFPDLRRPRVIWAGVSDPSGILEPVHARLNETLAVFGAKREKKKYVPHVTLARVRGRVDAGRLAERLAERQTDGRDGSDDLWIGSQAVDAIALVLSELGRGRPPRYTVMGHYGP